MKIEVYPLRCGSTSVDEALPFSDRSRNPLAFTGVLRGRRHRITVPVRAFLVLHPAGPVLVDTGWDTAVRRDARAYEGLANYFASPGLLPPGEAVTEQLARFGLSPEDLRFCVLTHLDIDHAGGLRLVSGAPHILVSRAEWKAANRPDPRYRPALWREVTFETVPDSTADLFGDGSVVLFPLHGHSAGMTALRIGTPERYLILAGDGGYGRSSWEDLRLPGVCRNRRETLLSLKKLQQFGHDPRCAGIWMTHDPEELPACLTIEEE